MGGLQDESENWELHQEIKSFWGWNQNKKSTETALHITNAIINIKYIAYYIIKKGMGVVELYFYFPKNYREMCTVNWVFYPYCEI